MSTGPRPRLSRQTRRNTPCGNRFEGETAAQDVIFFGDHLPADCAQVFRAAADNDSVVIQWESLRADILSVSPHS